MGTYYLLGEVRWPITHYVVGARTGLGRGRSYAPCHNLEPDISTEICPCVKYTASLVSTELVHLRAQELRVVPGQRKPNYEKVCAGILRLLDSAIDRQGPRHGIPQRAY